MKQVTDNGKAVGQADLAPSQVLYNERTGLRLFSLFKIAENKSRY